ncbi:MAG TPA: gas vesicle protein GvpG [Amycolatopsis sp.]|nr:gas vesicle protein GvpG [Amycolatopsis sp.]
MGVLSTIFGLPFAPVRGVLALGDLIKRRVDEELTDPASVRRELEAAEAAREAGEISADDEARTQQQVLNRLQVSEPDPAGAEANEMER